MTFSSHMRLRLFYLALLFAVTISCFGQVKTQDCGTTRCLNLVFDGDSISAGVGASHGRGLPTQVAAAIGVDVEVHKVAVGGRPVIECLHLFSQLVPPLFKDSTPHNLIVFHAGDNDLLQGRSVEQTYSAFTTYVAMAHNAGWKIIVSTELRRVDLPPAMEAKLEDYNQRLKQNRAGADAIVDLDAEPRLSNPSYRADPALFNRDKVHPSDGGYAILAGMLAAEINRISQSKGL